MIDFLKDNWIGILSALGAIIVWLAERQKRRNEGRVGINDATEGMQKMYDKFVEDASIQYDKLNEKIGKLQESESIAIKARNELSSTLEDIQHQMNADKKIIKELERKIAAYEQTIKNYEGKITDYELQVKKLKQELQKHK